jgi:hypothetical protein
MKAVGESMDSFAELNQTGLHVARNLSRELPVVVLGASADVDGQARQTLGDVIVQLPRKASAFLFLCEP